MSIATEISRINTAKSDIKTVINQDFEVINNETIDKYAEKMESAYNEYESYIPWEHGEGSEFTFKKGGAGSYLKELEINGNTEQDSYTGKNLINFPYYETTKTVNDITFTVKNDGTIHVQGTASARAEFLLRNRDINLSITEGETYTLATSGLRTIDNTLWLDTYGQTGNFLDKWALSQTTTYTSAVAQSKDIKPLLKISVTNGATVNTDVKVWLYKGSYDETTTYEPYVGGILSPNPNYPQDIRVVTGNNSVNVIGKNLFDKTITKSLGDGRIRETILETGKKLKWNSVSTTTDYIWLCYVIKDISNYVGKTVRFKTNFSASASNTPQYTIGICDSDGNNRTSKANSTTSGNTISFTIPSLSGTQTYLYVLLYANSGGTLNSNDYVDFTNMILTIDNEDMTYIPYQSQTYPINLGTIELCKIGDYQDYIYKDNGKWYKHSEIGKVVLNGSEENLSYSSTANRLQMPFNLQTQNWGALALTLCDHFTRGDTETVDGSFNITRTTLFFKNNNLTSLNDWKTWLGSNNTSVYYVLATPTNTEITDTTLISQLEELTKLDTHNNYTAVTATGGLINPELECVLFSQPAYQK